MHLACLVSRARLVPTPDVEDVAGEDYGLQVLFSKYYFLVIW